MKYSAAELPKQNYASYIETDHKSTVTYKRREENKKVE